MKPMTKELFWELLGPEHRRAEAFCRKLCGSKDDGDDLYQDALLAAFQGIEALRETQAFRNWLYSIIIRRFRNRFREPWWKRRTTLTPKHIENTAFDPSERFDSSRWLSRALGALKTDEKALIVLFEIEGWSIEELSEIYGRPQGTIKARLSRSRKKMRRALSPYLTDRKSDKKTNEAKYALSKSTAINE
jgi:RNA polymerase sigma-70 factor (ECF subfamily)